MEAELGRAGGGVEMLEREVSRSRCYLGERDEESGL